MTTPKPEEEEESLADELSERVDEALEGSVAKAEDVKEAFRSS